MKKITFTKPEAHLELLKGLVRTGPMPDGYGTEQIFDAFAILNVIDEAKDGVLVLEDGHYRFLADVVMKKARWARVDETVIEFVNAIQKAEPVRASLRAAN